MSTMRCAPPEAPSGDERRRVAERARAGAGRAKGRWALLGLALAASALAADPPPTAGKPADSRLKGQLSVREVEVSVALPDDLSPWKARAIDAASFLALRDGREQSIARAERQSTKDRAWTSLVWIDRALASPTAVADTVRALAERSRELVRLGTVEVVIADPEPRVALAASADATVVRTALEDAATVPAGAAATPTTEANAGWRLPDGAALRRQADRLAVWVAERRAVGPRALWLPLDGAPLPLPAVAALGGRALAGSALAPADGDRVAVLADLERVLAAYGWTTLAMVDAGGVDPAGGRPRPEGAYDRFLRDSPNHSGSAAILFRWPLRRGDRTAFDPRTLDAELDPRYAAARLVAEETGGWMIAGSWDLPAAFDALAARWRIWLVAGEPSEGAVESLVVKLKKGPELRATRWLRSAVPPAVSAARLRRALDGATLGGDLAPTASGVKLAASALSADVALADVDDAGAALWRWRSAVHLADGGVAFPEVHAERGAASWHVELGVPSGAESVVLLVEELRSERFGATRVPVPREPGPPGSRAPVHAAMK